MLEHVFDLGGEVEAKVGENGQWTLDYDGELQEGEHKVYAVARKAGELIRSAAKTFTKTAQAAEETPATTTDATQATGLSKVVVYYIAGIGGLLAAFLVVWLLARARHH